MARIQNGSIISGMKGKLGDIVIKRYRNKRVASRVPDMSNVVPSEKQKGKRNLFREAVSYAQQVIRDPEQKAAWQKTIKRGKSVYHAAIASYLKAHQR